MMVRVAAVRSAVPVETSVPGFPVLPLMTDPRANRIPRASQAAMPMSVHPVAFFTGGDYRPSR